MFKLFLGVTILLSTAFSAFASCENIKMMRGLNLGGGDLTSTVPGTYGHQYFYPSDEEIESVASEGFNTIRIPFRWERVQATASGDFTELDITHLKRIAAKAAELDLCVLFDNHNYAKYWGAPLSDDSQNGRHLRNFWRKFSEEVGHTENVALGIMNEPYKVSAEYWVRAMNYLIPGLRDDGVENVIMMAGPGWGSVASYGGTFKDFDLDPLNKTFVELHAYFDDGDQGNDTSCSSRAALLHKLINYDKSVKYFIGEFGITPTETCLSYLDEFVKIMEENKNDFIGYSYWKYDRWNPSDTYMFSINIRSGGFEAQLETMRQYWTDGQILWLVLPAIMQKK